MAYRIVKGKIESFDLNPAEKLELIGFIKDCAFNSTAEYEWIRSVDEDDTRRVVGDYYRIELTVEEARAIAEAGTSRRRKLGNSASPREY
jgi:hypothetical protein